jgi:hypothetical protein
VTGRNDYGPRSVPSACLQNNMPVRRLSARPSTVLFCNDVAGVAGRLDERSWEARDALRHTARVRTALERHVEAGLSHHRQVLIPQ